MDPLHKRMRDRVQARVGGGTAWYEIRNQDDGTAVVRIYEEIGYWGVTAEDFARDLAQVTASEIEVQINSPGGDVFDGIAIFNALRTHPARVTTRVDGLAASAASVIAQAGDHRVMVEAGQMMIHEAWGLAIGPADEIREFADLLDQQNDVIAGIYASRSGGDADKFRQLMADETWLTHDQAVELGLADEVLVPARKDTKNRVAINVAELAAALAVALKIPSAGEQEEPPTSSGEPTVVDPEQAERLLASITLTKETHQ